MYPPPNEKFDLLAKLYDLSSGENPAITNSLESGNYQEAVSLVYSALTVLNIPLDWVGILIYDYSFNKIYKHSP